MDYAKIFRDYRDDVYRLAVCYTHSREEAEDVCQSVFMKLLEQKTIEPGKEKQWLMRVTANACRNILRSHWWKYTAPLEDSYHLESPEADHTLQLLLSLEPKYRVVLYMHYYEEFSTREIASLLNITQSTVTTRLSRGRQLLKAKLEEDL